MSIYQLALDLGGDDLLQGQSESPKEEDESVAPKIPFFRYADQQENMLAQRQERMTRSLFEGTTCVVENDPGAILFDQFCTANTFQGITRSFQQLCDLVEEQPRDHEIFYQRLKLKLTSWKAQSLWSKLDKRSSHREYKKGTCCLRTRVLIIGGGPCGLRTAIEVVLLGGKAVIIEKRDRFSRNNVLHLWPYLITDLKALGAKKFFGKFCSGSIDHISIRALECILLKIALLIGVEIHPGVTFKDICEPPEPVPGLDAVGWRAEISPPNHPVSEYEFDVLIGADGKRNTLREFRRKEFRGKLAIAVTANFINRNTQAEASVEEISGVAFIFNQKFFKDLNAQTGIDLENIVYYKDDTHYFVMTAKKHSLLLKGVLIQDFEDPARLLSKENVDQDCLLAYAREAADVSTRQQLPQLEFAHNHYGQPDVAMFDFTSMFAAEHASRVIDRRGHKLLVGLVGDSLLEPFWPTGSGCARGFMGVFDAAWMIRSWASGKMTPLEVMAERESIYQLLSQTTPENINKNFAQYTIDPNVRYPNLNPAFFKPHQVKHQYDGQDLAYLDQIVQIANLQSSRYEMIRDSHNLLKWFQRQLEPYRHIVKVLDLSSTWQNGLALCALIHKYRPELVDVYALDHSKVAENNQLAYDVAEKEFGICPITTGIAMAGNDMPDKLSMNSYLSHFFEYFRKESIKPAKIARVPHPMKMRSKPRSPGSKQAMINKLGSRIKPILEEFQKDNDGDYPKKRRQAGNTHAVGKKRTPVHVGVRGQNKVSALAQDLAEKFKGHKVVEVSDVKKTHPRPLLQKNADSDLCYFCKKTVYLVERYTAEGLYFHRGCFRCEYCSTSLRIGGYSFLRSLAGVALFYCHHHHGLKKPLRRTRKRSFGENDAANGVDMPSLKVTIPPVEMDESNVDGTIIKTPERIEYMTESEQEESEYDQTQHNLSESLLNEDNSDSESSSDDLIFEDDDLSEGEISLVELAKSYSKKLSKSLQMKKKKKRKSGDEDSGSDTETGTVGASDADWESGSDTERESDTDLESLFTRRRRQSVQSLKGMSGLDRSKETSDVSNREKLLLSPTSLKPFGYTSIYKTTTKPQEKKELKPSPTTAAIMKNRMAFFSMVSEPVRINAQSFLGLVPPPEEKKQPEIVEDDEPKEIPPHSGVEPPVVEEGMKKDKKKKRRHGRGDKHRLTGEVEGSMLPGMQEAAPVITVLDSSNEEAGEDDEDKSTDQVTGEDDSSTKGEEEETESSESDTEDQVESIEDMLADSEQMQGLELEGEEELSAASDAGDKVELMEEARKSDHSGELVGSDSPLGEIHLSDEPVADDVQLANVLLDKPLIVVTAEPDDSESADKEGEKSIVVELTNISTASRDISDEVDSAMIKESTAMAVGVLQDVSSEECKMEETEQLTEKLLKESSPELSDRVETDDTVTTSGRSGSDSVNTVEEQDLCDLTKAKSTPRRETFPEQVLDVAIDTTIDGYRSKSDSRSGSEPKEVAVLKAVSDTPSICDSETKVVVEEEPRSQPTYRSGSQEKDLVPESTSVSLLVEASVEDGTIAERNEGTVSDSAKNTNSDVVTDVDKVTVSGVTQDHTDVDFVDSSPIDNESRLFVTGPGKINASLASEEEMDDYSSDEFVYLIKDSLHEVVCDVLASKSSQSSDSDVIMETGVSATDASTSSATEIPSQISGTHVSALEKDKVDESDLCNKDVVCMVSTAISESLPEDMIVDDSPTPVQNMGMDIDVNDSNLELREQSQDVDPILKSPNLGLESVENNTEQSESPNLISAAIVECSQEVSTHSNGPGKEIPSLHESKSQLAKEDDTNSTEIHKQSKLTQENTEGNTCQPSDITTIVDENLMDTSELLDLTQLAEDNLNDTSEINNLTVLANDNLGETTELVINNLGDTMELVCDNIKAIADQLPEHVGDHSDHGENLAGTMELVRDNQSDTLEPVDLTVLVDANVSNLAIVPDLSIMVEDNIGHLDVNDSLFVAPVSKDAQKNTSKETETNQMETKVEQTEQLTDVVGNKIESVGSHEALVESEMPCENLPMKSEVDKGNLKEIVKDELHSGDDGSTDGETVPVSDVNQECIPAENSSVSTELVGDNKIKEDSHLDPTCKTQEVILQNHDVLSILNKQGNMLAGTCLEEIKTLPAEKADYISDEKINNSVKCDVEQMDVESKLDSNVEDVDLSTMALDNIGDMSTTGDLTMLMEANKPHVDAEDSLYINELLKSEDKKQQLEDVIVDEGVKVHTVASGNEHKTKKSPSTPTISQESKGSKYGEVEKSVKATKGKDVKAKQSSSAPEVNKSRSSKMLDQSKTPTRPSKGKDQQRTPSKPNISSEKSTKILKSHDRSRTSSKSSRPQDKSKTPRLSKSQDKSKTPPRGSKSSGSKCSANKVDRAKEVELISKLDRQTFGSPEILEGCDKVMELDRTKHSIKTFGALDHRAQPKLHRSASSPIKPQPSTGPRNSTPKSNLERSSSLGSEEDRGLNRKCMSREDLQADAIKRIDDLISSLTEEKDGDLSGDDGEKMDTEEEEDYQEVLDTSQIVAFTIDDEAGKEKSYSVDEKFVNLRDRRHRKHSSNQSKEPKSVSDSSSFTISTPSSSVASISSISELHSTQPSASNSTGSGLSKSTTDESLSKSKNTSPLERSLSFEKIVEINMNNEDLLDDLEIDAMNLTLDVDKSKHKDTQNNYHVNNHSSPSVSQSIPNKSETIMSSIDSTPFQSANSTVATDDSCYYTPETNSVQSQSDSIKRNKKPSFSSLSPIMRHDIKSSDTLSDASDQKSMHSSKSDSHASSPYSPNKLKDAKWKFFCEAPMVVRMDHTKVFDDIPNKTSISAQVKASNRKNTEKSLELSSNWTDLESSTPTSPTAGIPHKDSASGENDVLYTPATSMKGKHTNGLSNRDDDLKKPEVRKRLLPATPAEKSKVNKSRIGVTADEISQFKEDELDVNRKAAMDEESRTSHTGKNKRRPETAGGAHSSRAPHREPPTHKRPMSATADLAIKSPTLGSTNSPLKVLSASDGASASDHSGASPNIDRKGKKDKKEKKSKEDKENHETGGKKEKKRSFLSLLLPSRSVDKKERTKSPPPEKGSFFSRTKSPPPSKNRAQQTQGKSKAGQVPRRSAESQEPSTSGVKMRNRSKSPRNVADQIREEEIQRRSIYDEFAPLVEDIAEGGKKNKEDLQERIQLVAPPPAKAPFTSLRPPTATSNLRLSLPLDLETAGHNIPSQSLSNITTTSAPKLVTSGPNVTVAPSGDKPGLSICPVVPSVGWICRMCSWLSMLTVFCSRSPSPNSVDEFETESECGDDKISVRSFQVVTQGMTEEELAKMLKKQQKAVAKRQKESELKRLRVAQEIQRHLEEVECKQRQVEEKGIEIERALRGEGKEIPTNIEDAEKDESVLMQDWFNIVHEKSMLIRYESELLVHARELELEDRQSRLEHQLRDIMALEDTDKTEEKREEEQKVLQEILEVVEQRDALVALLEEDRLKEKKQDACIVDLMSSTGFELSPASYVHQLRHSTSQERTADDDR